MADDMDSSACFVNKTVMATDSLSNIILATVFSVINCFIVLANAIIIISLLRSLNSKRYARKKKSIGKLLMASMAFSDLLLGLFAIPLAIYEVSMDGKWYLGFGLCAAKVVSDIYACTVSIYHVTFMAIDRYLAVCRPLLHRTLTLKTGFIMALISWSLPAAVLFCPFLFKTNGLQVDGISSCARHSNVCVYDLDPIFRSVMLAMFVHVPVAFVFALYAVILRAIRQFHLRKLQFVLKDRDHLRENTKVNVVDGCLGGKAIDNLCCKFSRMVFQNLRDNRCPTRQGPRLATCVLVVASVKAMAVSQVSVSFQTASFRDSPPAQVPVSPQTDVVAIQESVSPQTDVVAIQESVSHQTDVVAIQESVSPQTDVIAIQESVSPQTSSYKEFPSPSLSQNPSPADTPTPKPKKLLTHQRGEPADESRIKDQPEKRQLSQDNQVVNEMLDQESRHSAGLRLPGNQSRAQAADRPRKHNIKAVTTIGMIIVCFTICWLPMGWVLMVSTLFHLSVSRWLLRVCVWLGYLNSALNPLVYCSNTSIRQAVLTLLCRCRQRRPSLKM